MAHHLFAYGTLRPGRAPGGLLEVVSAMRPLGAATVRGRVYDLGLYPGLILDSSGGPVHGQVLEIPDGSILAALDGYEGFDPDRPESSLFIRVRCPVTMSDGRELSCWIYVYNRDIQRARPIAAGDDSRGR